MTARNLLGWALFAFIIVVAVVLSGCEPQVYPKELREQQTNNPTIPVDLLFETEGCRVFAFRHEGRDHYFAKCVGATASTSTMQPQRCGKSPCDYPEEIATGVAE